MEETHEGSDPEVFGPWPDAARQWVDMDNLKKGDCINPEQVEPWCGSTRETAKFGLVLLRLANLIKDDLRNREIPLHVVVRREGFGLRILTDEEAADYLPTAWQNKIDGAREKTAELMLVDTAQVTDKTLDKIERDLMRQAFVNRAMIEAEREHRQRLRIGNGKSETKQISD